VPEECHIRHMCRFHNIGNEPAKVAYRFGWIVARAFWVVRLSILVRDLSGRA